MKKVAISRTLGLLAALAFGAASPVFAGGASDSAAAPKKPVEIRLAWWGGENRHKATVAAAEAFMRKNPDIIVKTEYQGFEGFLRQIDHPDGLRYGPRRLPVPHPLVRGREEESRAVRGSP
jgi:ABC-type glycerol-3-phosphate transport system substrate-binding protein